MNLKPIKNRVLCIQDEPEKTTESGFEIPDVAQKKQLSAKVIGVGPRVKSVRPGDNIIFGQYAYSEISFAGQTFCMLAEEDILGIK